MWPFSHKEPAEDTAPNTPTPRLLSYQAANLQGIGARARQEDSFLIVNALDVTEMKNKGLFAVVADGMGGMKDGKIASETAISCLRGEFAEFDRDGDIAEQLRRAVVKASAQVLSRLGGDGGSTVVACIIFRERLYFASVGDSFILLKREGHLYRLNREHTYRNQLYLEAIRDGSMDPEPAESNPEKAALTQFLGMDGMNEVDYLRSPFPLRENDALLICSDGVGGVLTDGQMLDYLGRATPTEACAAIDEEIRRQGRKHQDNYTALCIYCGY